MIAGGPTARRIRGAWHVGAGRLAALLAVLLVAQPGVPPGSPAALGQAPSPAGAPSPEAPCPERSDASGSAICPDDGVARLSLFGGLALEVELPIDVARSSYTPDGPLMLSYGDDASGLALHVTALASPVQVAPSGSFVVEIAAGTESWSDSGQACTLGLTTADALEIFGTVLCDGLPSAGGPVTLVATFDAWAPRAPGVRLGLALDGWLSVGCSGVVGQETFAGSIGGRTLELLVRSATLDVPIDLLFADPSGTRLELVDLSAGSGATWGGAAGGTSFGSFTLASDGRSGSMAATLFPATPAASGDVTVAGDWACPEG